MLLLPLVRPVPRILSFVAVLSLACLAPSISRAMTDSVVVPFRVYGSSATTHFVPGQFNGWNPNSVVSQMTYDAGIGAWLRLYTFKVHAPGDVQRTLGDSVYQYKFNAGGGSGGWFSDPLNPERNANDNNNSILRLRDVFWFEPYPHISLSQITRFTIGLVHGRTDTVTRVEFATAIDQTSTLTRTDITSSYQPTTRTVDHTLSSPVGEHAYVQVTAYLSTGDSTVYARGGYNVVVAPMPAGLKHGVTMPPLGVDSVGFRIRLAVGNLALLRIAPAGQSAALATPIVMKKHVSSNDWWTYVTLPQGTYDYLFEIGSGRQIPDPWGRLFVGSSGRFTMGSEGLSADDYEWNSTSYQRPLQKDLVIYELNIGEFAGGAVGHRGTFQDMIGLLPYLDSLGVNAIELMPVTDYGQLGASGFSWGYDVSSYFAVEPGYGSARDFKELIDSAHAMGMAVILDVVYNHLNDPSALWQLAPDVVTNPYFKNVGGAYNEDGLAFFRDVDHWTVETQEHVYESLRMWIDEFKIDGFRYDYTQGIGWNLADTTKGILGWANRIHREYNGQVYQIAEHLPESPALVYHSGISGGWHDSFRDLLFDEARFRTTSLFAIEDQVLDLGAFSGNDTPSSPGRYADRSEPVNYTVSHDEQSLVYEMTVWQGRPMNEALQRDKLYAVAMFTSLGVPMLWQGQETGESRGWADDGGKLSYRPVDWTRIGTIAGRSHWTYYRTLIRQRTSNPALRSGLLRKLHRYETEGQKVLVWGMEDNASGAGVVVVANFNPTETTVTSVPWISDGTWYDIFTQAPIFVSGASVPSIVVPAYTAFVYSNRSDAELNIPTSIEALDESGVPSRLDLRSNYPNPFNPSTTVLLDVPETMDLTVKVYSILGTEVRTLASGSHGAGSHRLTWDGRDAAGRFMSSGTYLVRVAAGSSVLVRKMLLVR